jgi:hypothetical protein
MDLDALAKTEVCSLSADEVNGSRDGSGASSTRIL